MQIVFLSANKLGFEVLKELKRMKSVNISAIVTLSSNASTVMYDGVDAGSWLEFDSPVYQIESISKEKRLFESLKPDIVIACGWRQIIPKEILDIPPKGFIGFHPTLLPYGRGSAPIINSILKGIRNSGVTMYQISEGVDDGDIIGQEKFTIEKDDYAEEVYEKVIIASRKLINFYIYQIQHGGVRAVKQDESKVVVFPKRTLKQNKIDLEKESIDQIYAKIRALSKPYNGAYIEKDGKKLVIWKAGVDNQ
jgi:methionyl-tRNA formyltransferase